MSLIPVTILTGFLGSGKTTLLKRVLTEAHGMKIAVIENEFGEENIDSDILKTSSTEQILQMNNGCICCSIRSDLRDVLQDLARKKNKGELNFDKVIIETTGLADPGPVAQTFFMDEEVAENYLVDSILTLVDVKHAKNQLNERQEAQRQVGFADKIFLSKTDLVTETEKNNLIYRLKKMNPRAEISEVNFGNVELNKVFDLSGFNLNEKLELDENFLKTETHDNHNCYDENCQHEHHHHHHEDDVKSFVFRTKKQFDPVKLEDFLGAIVNIYGPKMLRYKGVLNMFGTDRKVIFQGVHQLMGSDLGAAWESEERESRLVFIGINLPEEIFYQGLEQSLI